MKISIMILIVLTIIGWAIGLLLTNKILKKTATDTYMETTRSGVSKASEIMGIFVVSRLPVTITPDIQYCIKSNIAFIFKSEYISTMTNPDITEYNIHIPYIDGSEVKYVHMALDTDDYFPALDEVWSERYVDALNANISYSMHYTMINEMITVIRSSNMSNMSLSDISKLINQDNNIVIPVTEYKIQTVVIDILPDDIRKAIAVTKYHINDRRIITEAFIHPKYRILEDEYPQYRSLDQEE